jgi:hypothetical protein
MPFTKGQHYSWSRILEETGADGSPPYYLPHRGTEVVAACLTLDLDPEAPLVILAGNGPKISEYADFFCIQANAIPVFVKFGDRNWLYCGVFKLLRPSTDPVEIARHSARARRSDVYKLLFMEEVTP